MFQFFDLDATQFADEVEIRAQYCIIHRCGVCVLARKPMRSGKPRQDEPELTGLYLVHTSIHQFTLRSTP